MFFPNLVSNSLVTNSRSSSEEVQVKGKRYRAPEDAGKAREGVQLGLVGPPSAPGPLNLQPQAPPPRPSPTPCSWRGACFRVSGARLHVGLAAPATPLLWPQCPGRPAGLQTGAPACLGPWAAHISYGTLHVWQKTWNACMSRVYVHLPNMPAIAIILIFFLHICVFPSRYIEIYKFELLYTPHYMLAQLNFMF